MKPEDYNELQDNQPQESGGSPNSAEQSPAAENGGGSAPIEHARQASSETGGTSGDITESPSQGESMYSEPNDEPAGETPRERKRLKERVRHVHHKAKHHAKRFYHSKHYWWIVLPAVVLLTALYSLFFLDNPQADKQHPNAPRTELLVVPPNASMAQIADTLRHQGILRSEITFRAAAKMIRAGHKVHGGTFEIDRGLSNLALIQRLIGDKYQVVFQIHAWEGMRMKDIANLASTNLMIPIGDIYAAASDPAFLRQLGLPPEAKNAEGYLYPDDYKWLYPVNGRTLVQAMVTRFHQMVPDSLLNAATSRGLSPYQLVTVASIVDGETKDSSEKYLVASVYENRYRTGMRLQADPTVQYGAGLDRPITHADIMKMTDYNTYLKAGLPPGPINNPNVESIRAAAYPAETDYLFFVAKRDGSRTHYFSNTYADHVQNIKKEEKNIAMGGSSR